MTGMEDRNMSQKNSRMFPWAEVSTMPRILNAKEQPAVRRCVLCGPHSFVYHELRLSDVRRHALLMSSVFGSYCR
jgi:hypothetical protein